MSQYSSQLRDTRWQKKRLELLESSEWTCSGCGESGTKELHVHHKYYLKGKAPWEYPNEALEVLCEKCHTEAKSTNDNFKREYNICVEIAGSSEIDELLSGFLKAHLWASQGFSGLPKGNTDLECEGICAALFIADGRFPIDSIGDMIKNEYFARHLKANNSTWLNKGKRVKS